MNELTLTGLDGSNPLGFLAALGVLRVVDGWARARGGSPALRWQDDGGWHPRLRGVDDIDRLVRVVIEDAATWAEDDALALAWNDDGLCPPEDASAERDLKPPPAVMRHYLEVVAEGCHPDHRRAADTVAAYGTEVAVDNNGNVKPTALHFTAGQQTFLSMVATLREGLRPEHVHEALVGPWRGVGTLPTLAWDAGAARLYALRASDPSKEKRGGNPGADWLAFVGLAAFPVHARPRARGRGDADAAWQAVTTGVRGGWKDATFTWPVWTPAITWATARTLVAIAGLADTSPRVRAARGIGAVFASGIVRNDQGGYGSFTPARPA